jgi:hypothetical protein
MKHILEQSCSNYGKLNVSNNSSTEINHNISYKTACFFTCSSEWMNYMYILWVGPTKFLKTLKPFQKCRCQKSVMNKVHTKFRRCLDVLAHKIWKYLQYVWHFTQSCKWLSSLRKLELQSPRVFWRLYTLKSRTVTMETITHDSLSVSKSVAQ